MKKTVLFDEHIRLKARMVEFSGWNMPVMYTNVIDEHNTCRNKVALFDTSHMGEFILTGRDSVAFLQKIVAKDISNLKENKCVYTVMCNEKGGVIDDLIIYKHNDEKFMIVVNAGTIDKDFKHMNENKEGFEIELENISDETAKLDVQGLDSFKILEKLFNTDVKRFSFKEAVLNKEKAIISGTGYTGEKGFELYIPNDLAVETWNKILGIGKEFGIKPAGLGARDTLRLECCYSLYGHELNDAISPIEGGIKFTVSMDKDDFIGKKALQKIIDRKERILVAFELMERGIPREHYKIYKDNEEIGFVTSGTMSPTFKKGLGLALIKTEYSQLNTEIDIKIREKLYKAKVVKRPFYAYNG